MFSSNNQIHSNYRLIQAGILIVLLLTIHLVSADSIVPAPGKNIKQAGTEYEELGKRFAQALIKKDLPALSDMFDMNEFAHITAANILDSQSDIESFSRGFLKNPKDKLLNQIFTPVFSQDAGVKYMRVIKNNQPLIRIDYKSNGHEYIILQVKRQAHNKLAVVDLFFMTAGRNMSASVGAMSQLIMKPSKSMLKRLFGRVDVDTKMMSTLKELGQMRVNGKYREGYALLQTLPEDVQNSRVLIDLGLLFTQKISDDEYRKQLSKLDKYYGHDDSTVFILIDHYYFTHEFTKMLSALDRLAGILGEDGAILTLKANAYYSMNDYDNAKKACYSAIQIEPEYTGAYWTLATVLTKHEQYSELIKVLDLLQSRFGYTFTAKNFAGIPIYSKFVQSPEFKAKYGRLTKTTN